MLITSHPEFPIRIIAHEMVKEDDPIIYVPEILCTAQIIMCEDDSIGHCICSNCGASVRYFDKYCSHCGGRIILAEVKDPELFIEGEPDES